MKIENVIFFALIPVFVMFFTTMMGQFDTDGVAPEVEITHLGNNYSTESLTVAVQSMGVVGESIVEWLDARQKKEGFS
jgi:hypothetical protein